MLYEGREIYFGDTLKAKEYFTNMRYICPDRQITSDFLTSLTNPAERIVKPGYEQIVPRSPDEFAESWRDSQTRRHLLNEISRFEDEFPIDGPQLDAFIASRKAQQTSLTFDDFLLYFFDHVC